MSVVICGPDGPVFAMHQADGRAARSAEMLAHAAMDTVDAEARTSTNLWLGPVERLGDFFVFARRTTGATILLVLRERLDAEARAFCSQAHELYIRAALNPLYRPGSKLTSPRFREAIRRLASSRLGLSLS